MSGTASIGVPDDPGETDGLVSVCDGSSAITGETPNTRNAARQITGLLLLSIVLSDRKFWSKIIMLRSHKLHAGRKKDFGSRSLRFR